MIDTDFRLLVSAGAPRESAARAAEAVPSGGVFYYALGGGMGHLMRAHAVSRAFSRVDARPFVTLTNARFAQPEVPIRFQLEGRPDSGELMHLVRELLAALKPSVLVVDAFPAGILGELEPVLSKAACRKISVLRRLEPAWAKRWELAHVLPAHYDGVALIEPGARFPSFPETVRAIETAPVLAKNASELLTPDDARAALGHEGDSPLVLAAICGEPLGDYGILRAAVNHLPKASGDATLLLAAPIKPAGHAVRTIFHVPLMEVLPGVDLVIGPCGYNLAHETPALGVPAIFLPQRRTYDDQRGRSEGRVVAHSGDELESLIREALSVPGSRAFARPRPHFRNGADEVAGLIAS